MRLGCSRCNARRKSLPYSRSAGEGKYVGEVSPQLPRIEATWMVMPTRSPARSRLALRSRQSARGVRSCRKCAWTSISTRALAPALRRLHIVVGAAEVELVGAPGLELQIGILALLVFEHTVLIVDIVEVVDRAFSGGHG